ncbi:MAG: hypothetical protein JWQ86_1769 [Mycobacterium sp.]|nr:hypothetical protein [Mycobacterium sp.]
MRIAVNGAGYLIGYTDYRGARGVWAWTNRT